MSNLHIHSRPASIDLLWELHWYAPRVARWLSRLGIRLRRVPGSRRDRRAEELDIIRQLNP